jgi:hypothetical protein
MVSKQVLDFEFLESDPGGLVSVYLSDMDSANSEKRSRKFRRWKSPESEDLLYVLVD